MPTVVVVGASNDPKKFGNKAVRAYQRQGWKVIPVNPSEETIEGLPVVRRLEDISEAIDRISLYVPPAVGLALLPAIRDKAPKEFWVNPGAESDALIAEAEKLGLDPINACSIVDIGERP
ncbi:MAG: CoA-binding protein [Deltaproteobacteria bacterium]|nr:CoA-binding protein [Deltaproteobacteria bacterium]